MRKYQSYFDKTTFEFNQEQTFDLAPWAYQIFTTNIAVGSINVSSHEGLTSIATKGGTLQLTTDVLPTNATNKAVTWGIQSGENYASVSETGLVTAIANGSVVVKARSLSDPSVTKTFTVSIQVEDIAGGGTLPNTPNSETNTATNTGSSTGNVTKSSIEKIKGIVTFNEDSLKNTSGNIVTLSVDSGTEQILIPTEVLHAQSLRHCWCDR
ncbi:hypothetical protein J2T13_004088 [Paenibacillus sp. DS2015]|uniref:Ig-like domain-containing protein n=1 Tax=Paenibacillus sp. DS2015 TaxID=3373917 RepID=UPI003D223767